MYEKEETKIEEKAIVFQPFSLKKLSGLKIVSLIKSDQMHPDKLLNLAIEYQEYIKFLLMADDYVDLFKKSINHIEPEQHGKLIELINKIQGLLCGLIDSGSEHVERFLLAIDDLFDKEKLCCKEALVSNEENLFEILKQILEIVSDSNKALEIFNDPQEIDLEELGIFGTSSSAVIYGFTCDAISESTVCLVDLLINLDLFSRRSLLAFLGYAFFKSRSVEIARLLNSKSQITSEELQFILEEDNNIFDYIVIEGRIDVARYLIELIESTELNLYDIINEEYGDGRNLLISAVRCECLSADMVELLIAKGADVSVEDDEGHNALFYAQEKYNNFDKQKGCMAGDEEMNKRIECLAEMNKIIEVLTKSTDKDL